MQAVAPSTSASTTQGSTDKSAELFGDLITFIAQVAQCYPVETKEFPAQMKELLLGGSGGVMASGELQKTIVRNLVMLRNKEVIDSIE